MSENDEGELLSLTEEKTRHYSERFWEPESFTQEEIDATIGGFFVG